MMRHAASAARALARPQGGMPRTHNSGGHTQHGNSVLGRARHGAYRRPHAHCPTWRVGTHHCCGTSGSHGPNWVLSTRGAGLAASAPHTLASTATHTSTAPAGERVMATMSCRRSGLTRASVRGCHNTGRCDLINTLKPTCPLVCLRRYSGGPLDLRLFQRLDPPPGSVRAPSVPAGATGLCRYDPLLTGGGSCGRARGASAGVRRAAPCWLRGAARWLGGLARCPTCAPRRHTRPSHPSRSPNDRRTGGRARIGAWSFGKPPCTRWPCAAADFAAREIARVVQHGRQREAQAPRRRERQWRHQQGVQEQWEEWEEWEERQGRQEIRPRPFVVRRRWWRRQG